ARNAEKTIERAVRSILEQTLTELELVVVDDGSTDRTGAILRSLAAADRRLSVISTQGLGLVGALRSGLERCRGQFIARMDADDEGLPRRLEVTVGALTANPRLGAVGTQIELFRDDRPVSPNMQLYARWLNGLIEPQLLFRDRFVESPLCHPSALLRREAL